jgi:zinc protease
MSSRVGVCLAGTLALASSLPSARTAQAANWGETYLLPNGLRVVLNSDTRFPTVTVLVRYHVGARQEPLGSSGMAHLLEHLTFRVPRPPSQGGTYASNFTLSSRNGSTAYEQTDYYTTTPSGDLEYALWTERWRMGINLDLVTESDRRQELDVVKNERRQRVEIQPYREGRHRLWTALFPAEHPFHEEVIGSMKELNAITLEQAKDYFRRYYGPANATLAVVGDFNPQEAKRIIQTYYGTLAPGQRPPERKVTPTTIVQPVVIKHDERYGRRSRVHLAWHTPGKYRSEHAAGEMTARLLGGTEASRLVMGVPEAVFAEAYQESMLAGSVFHVILEPRAGVSPEALVRKVDFVLGLLRATPPSKLQLDMAARRWLRDTLLKMEDSLAKARFLIDVITGAEITGDPLAHEQQRFSQVTEQQVQDFVRNHLGPEQRVMVLYTPTAATPGGAR